MARRHLKFDEWRQANDIDKQARVKRVMEKRKEGKSLRTIADEEGVSAKTIHKDLEDSGVTGVTPDEQETEPAKVKGKDGKEYAASKPKPTHPRRRPS